MYTKLIYSIPQCHKLIECAARNCLSSYEECGVDIHTSLSEESWKASMNRCYFRRLDI